MVIVLIHWKIKPDKVSMSKFLDFWQRTAKIKDRKGLVGEFLSEVSPKSDERNWITWDALADRPGAYRSFVNVGMWSDPEVFQEQVAQYFSENRHDFEHKLRVRTLLCPKAWRIGHFHLPIKDSAGTL